ncbi:MAG TPA: ATP-binding protein [Candidatus Bathyarchaeia archaeon]|nr:ATP-binding protein [Candidatus Bathyarchaeia archaeon]
MKNIYLENILAALPDHIYWLNRNNIFLGCNEQQAKDLGLSNSKEIVGKTLYDLFPKRIAKMLEENNNQVMESGQARIIEEPAFYPQKKAETYLSHKVPIKKNGAVIGMAGISINITDRRRVERQLKKEKLGAEKILKNQKLILSQITQEATGNLVKASNLEGYMKSVKDFYENLIALMPGHVYWMNKEGVYLGCNDKQAQSAGLNSRQEIVGKKNVDLPWNIENPTFAREVDKTNKKIIDSGIPQIVEEKATYENGQVAIFISSKVPIKNTEGDAIGLLGISQDVTELKITQKKLKSVEGRLDGMLVLSASIAHELRTPLASIRAGAQGISILLPKLYDAYRQAKKQGLINQPISEKLLHSSQDSLERIDSSARQAHQVIDMILMSINADDNNLKRNDFCSLEKCIHTAISEYVFQPGKEKLVHTEELKDFNFNGSEIQIKHIIFNLLRNALYFIEKVGKGEIFLWTSEEEKYNKLHFKDTGQGIPKQTLPKIFERFFTEGTHRGTGVGLSFCKMVMEGLGGKIECRSEFNKYTEFVLYFPK